MERLYLCDMKRPLLPVFALFLAQIILCIYGNRIFQKEANPFALIVVSGLLAIHCFRFFNQPRHSLTPSSSPAYLPWLHALTGMLGLFTAYEELRKIWVRYPEPGKISDVIPQLKAMSDRFFGGEFPYQPVILPTHEPFPVYMPMHWMPVQIANVLGTDPRWSAVILLMLAVGVSGYFLSKAHPTAFRKHTLPAMLLFALPVWGYVLWGKLDIAVSLEGIVAAWYVLLAAGLATRNHALIAMGIIGAVLSRYTLLFWLPLFAILLWLNAPRKHSYLIWGSVGAAVLIFFVFPFWMIDPSIVSKIIDYYEGCSEGSWVRPDAFTFADALSLNIHLRQWLPGTPEQNLPYAHFPQFIIQILIVVSGVYFYQKKWRNTMDVYTFSLLALSIMPMLFYTFSPMLFKYYMLMPLMVSAVLCWKVVAVSSFEKHI